MGEVKDNMRSDKKPSTKNKSIRNFFKKDRTNDDTEAKDFEQNCNAVYDKIKEFYTIKETEIKTAKDSDKTRLNQQILILQRMGLHLEEAMAGIDEYMEL